MKPSDMFRQNVWVTPFYEDDVVGLAKLIGDSHVLAGSDFPHPEGLVEPTEFADEVAELPPDAQRRILRDNLAGLVA
jgi:predicted TIM-barrel fold metal-dependent hydrolase